MVGGLAMVRLLATVRPLATVRLLVTGSEGSPAQPRVTGLMEGTGLRRTTALPGFRGGFRATGADRAVAAGTATQFAGMSLAVPRAGSGRRDRVARACQAIPGIQGTPTRHGVGHRCHATATAANVAQCQDRGTGPGHLVTDRVTGRAGSRRERTAPT